MEDSYTLQGKNISHIPPPKKSAYFKDDFVPFPQVKYASSLEGYSLED